jgi:hypothetical protein
MFWNDTSSSLNVLENSSQIYKCRTILKNNIQIYDWAKSHQALDFMYCHVPQCHCLISYFSDYIFNSTLMLPACPEQLTFLNRKTPPTFPKHSHFSTDYHITYTPRLRINMFTTMDILMAGATGAWRLVVTALSLKNERRRNPGA